MCRGARFVSRTESHLKELLLQHEITARPWSKVGTDMCESNGRTLLVMCDYYGNFVEVVHLKTTTSRSVTR